MMRSLWISASGMEAQTLNIDVTKGDLIRVFLRWSAPWKTYEGYDLYLLDPNDNLVDYSTDGQSDYFLDPVESIQHVAIKTGVYKILVREYSTSSDWDIEIFCLNHYLSEHQTVGGSVSTPTDAFGAFSVGATYWGSDTLEPFPEIVKRKFMQWLEEQKNSGVEFTSEQLIWLEMIKNHIATSVTIEVEDFNYAPFYEKGGVVKLYRVFGSKAEKILKQLNEVLVSD